MKNKLESLISEISKEVEKYAKPHIKKFYMSKGVNEPLFGVPIKDLNPIAKKYKGNQELAEELFLTKNYDLMYLAGMIADSKNMTKEDFERWIKNSNSFLISDYTVSIMLTDALFSLELADTWIESDEEMKASAGYYLYAWLLALKPDSYFSKEVLISMIDNIVKVFNSKSLDVQKAMNYFIYSIGISYIGLFDKCIEVVDLLSMMNTTCFSNTKNELLKAKEKDRLGFKRRNARC